MADRCYVGIDLGAESGRVIAGLFDGGRVRLDEVLRFPNVPQREDGSLRWNVHSLWNDIRIGLTFARAGYDSSIASVGVDTWGVDYVLLNENNTPIDQPYHYRDARTDGVMARAFETVSRNDIYDATGIQFLPFNTLYQLIAGNEREPDTLAQAERLLLMPDYLHHLLCGSTAVERTNATTTQLFDPATSTWSWDLIKRFDLPERLFGEIVEPGTDLGTVHPEIMSGNVRVVAPATHDTASAVVAVPTANTGRADWAYVSSGTWSLVGVEVPKPFKSAQALAFGLTNEGGIDGTTRLLKNVMGLWLVQKCREQFRRDGLDADYEWLARLATNATPLRTLFDPDEPHFLNPSNMPVAIADVCRESGQPVPDSPGAFVRACLESLALKYARVIGQLESVTGTRIEVIHVVGGGSRNRLLNQFTANATGRPVLAGPVEATALGNVLVQARAAGDIGSLADIRRVARDSFEIETFEPNDRDRWAEAAARFDRLRATP